MKNWLNRIPSEIIHHLMVIVLACVLVGSMHAFSHSPLGVRFERWLKGSSPLNASTIRDNLNSSNSKLQIETIKLLEERGEWRYFQETLPLATSTNLEVARAARRFVDWCRHTLRYYGWKEHSWGFDAPWGRVYTSNFLHHCAVDAAADAAVSNYMDAMLATNWPAIAQWSHRDSWPDGTATERDLQRFFLATPRTFQLQRRSYTADGAELEGLGTFPGLVTGSIPTVYVLLLESNLWKVSNMRIDLPDAVADEFLRD